MATSPVAPIDLVLGIDMRWPMCVADPQRSAALGWERLSLWNVAPGADESSGGRPKHLIPQPAKSGLAEAVALGIKLAASRMPAGAPTTITYGDYLIRAINQTRRLLVTKNAKIEEAQVARRVCVVGESEYYSTAGDGLITYVLDGVGKTVDTGAAVFPPPSAGIHIQLWKGGLKDMYAQLRKPGEAHTRLFLFRAGTATEVTLIDPLFGRTHAQLVASEFGIGVYYWTQAKVAPLGEYAHFWTFREDLATSRFVLNGAVAKLMSSIPFDRTGATKDGEFLQISRTFALFSLVAVFPPGGLESTVLGVRLDDVSPPEKLLGIPAVSFTDGVRSTASPPGSVVALGEGTAIIQLQSYLRPPYLAPTVPSRNLHTWFYYWTGAEMRRIVSPEFYDLYERWAVVPVGAGRAVVASLSSSVRADAGSRLIGSRIYQVSLGGDVQQTAAANDRFMDAGIVNATTAVILTFAGTTPVAEDLTPPRRLAVWGAATVWRGYNEIGMVGTEYFAPAYGVHVAPDQYVFYTHHAPKELWPNQIKTVAHYAVEVDGEVEVFQSLSPIPWRIDDQFQMPDATFVNFRNYAATDRPQGSAILCMHAGVLHTKLLSPPGATSEVLGYLGAGVACRIGGSFYLVVNGRAADPESGYLGYTMTELAPASVAGLARELTITGVNKFNVWPGLRGDVSTEVFARSG